MSEAVRSPRARRWTALSAAAVVAANVAGLWGIAVARRGARDEAARSFRLETASRARILESALHETRADLAFLAGSSVVSQLEGIGRPEHRLAAEAVVVFLRGHPEIAHLTVSSGKGYALLRTGRRGGLPVLWSASDAQAAAGGGPHSDREEADGRYPQTEVAFAGAGPDVVRLTAEIDADVWLAHALSTTSPGSPCALQDATGRALSRRTAVASVPEGLAADAQVSAGDWSAPGPWTLRCTSLAASDAATGAVESRYRLTLVLNAGAMILALLLGSFAIRQTLRRERLEAQAREEMRIRELERQLFHAERLGTVGRLAAGMAHEINNPLEGMSNYLTLARDDLARGDTDKARGRLEGVGQGMERIAGIVRQVLAQADPAAAAGAAAPVDVTALVRETLDFIGTRRELAAIALSSDLPPDPIVVPGNSVTLGQVLLNIVLNACEAQPGGGEVQVAVRDGGGHVTVKVADRGPGIAEADLDRIFDPFYSTKQSTGLGLSICHSIVRQHGGELTAANRPGGGALFRIRLPRA